MPLPTNRVTGDIIPASDHNDTAASVNAHDAANPFVAYGTGIDPTGAVDSTTALQAKLTAAAGKRLLIPPGTYTTSSKLTVPANTIVEGDRGGNYWDGGGVLIKKTNGDTNGNCVFEPAADCVFRNLRIEAPSLPYYLAAIYPTRPNNPSYGIYTATGQSMEMDHVTLAGFKLAGIGGSYSLPKLRNVHCFSNLYGIDWTAYDAHLTDCIVRHNIHSGYKNTGPADNIAGIRAEWNGRYGMILSGRSVLYGPRVDRNGWAGLYVQSGAWGCTVVGGEFNRNGAGGDSVYGRAAEVTTTATDPDGNLMYLAPATEQDKSHIRATGVQYLTVVGAEMHAGSDDAGAGARAPKYVYGLENSSDVLLANQDAIGWQHNHVNLGSVDYREGAGAQTYETGSVGYSSVRVGKDVHLQRTAADQLTIPDNVIVSGGYFWINNSNGFMAITEATAPGGSANQARVFARDNGSGKTQLCVIFGSGAVQVLSTEP